MQDGNLIFFVHLKRDPPHGLQPCIHNPFKVPTLRCGHTSIAIQRPYTLTGIRIASDVYFGIPDSIVCNEDMLLQRG